MSVIEGKTRIIEAMNRLQADPEIFRFLNARNSFYGKVIHDLRDTAEHNVTGLSGMCGTISPMLQEYFKKYYPDLETIRAAAAHEYSVCHIYNLVRDPAGKIWLLDGSAAQFFVCPRDVFDGKPYFVGTRDELKEKVQDLMPKTCCFLSEKFRAHNLRDLDHIDNFGYTRLRPEMNKALREWRRPALLTERLGAGWETTWGDKSRHQEAALSAEIWAGEVDFNPPRVRMFEPNLK